VREAASHLLRSWPLADGFALLLDAELARAEGDFQAEPYLRAVAVLEPLGLPYPLDLALLRAAEAEALHGRRPEAAALLRRAEEQAVRHGDVRLRMSAQQLADRAGLRTAEPAPAVPEPSAELPAFHLTPRELAVLRLVALGRTNRQIAEELYISPKTASVHVSNILAKLEVTGRGEAAAVAHRLRLVPVGA
jgi:DNA-binding CsgD family transcriptional regulator